MNKSRVDEGLRLYSFRGLLIRIQWQGEGIEDEIERFFTPLPFERAGAFNGPAHIELNIAVSDVPSKVPYGASEPAAAYDLLIREKGDSVYLTDGSSVFQIEARSGRGTITLHRSFSGKANTAKYNFFLMGLMHLLSAHGFYDLHGAGLFRDGRGYLLLGEPGSGKSSITLSLVHQGWHYQSDDALLLRWSADGIESHAFRKEFYIDPAAVRHYPEIARHFKASGNSQNAKQFVDMRMVYPDRFCPSCLPWVLIHTRIVPEPESRLVPMDRTSSLISLLKQSGSLYFNPLGVEVHMEILKQLVYQTDSYQLFAGRDLYEDPAKITGILSGAGLECAGYQ